MKKENTLVDKQSEEGVVHVTRRAGPMEPAEEERQG